jgi:hypothetical protein
MSAAVERSDDYILPVMIGNVRVPSEWLHPHIGYLRAEDHSLAELAAAIAAKVTASKARGTGVRDIGPIVRSAHGDRSA